MWVLYLVALAALFWYFCVEKRPKNTPPGPWFRFPLIGQMHYGFVGGRLEAAKNLKAK